MLNSDKLMHARATVLSLCTVIVFSTVSCGSKSVSLPEDTQITLFYPRHDFGGASGVILLPDGKVRILLPNYNGEKTIAIARSKAIMARHHIIDYVSNFSLSSDDVGGPGYEDISILFGKYASFTVTYAWNPRKHVEIPDAARAIHDEVSGLVQAQIKPSYSK